MFSTNTLDTISCYAVQSQQPNTWLLLVYNTPLHGTLLYLCIFVGSGGIELSIMLKYFLGPHGTFKNHFLAES